MADTQYTRPAATRVHPVDRMAEIKAQTAALDTEYQLLRQQVVDGQISPIGRLWEAVISTQTQRRISVRDAERLLPPRLFSELVTTTSQTNVNLRKREG